MKILFPEDKERNKLRNPSVPNLDSSPFYNQFPWKTELKLPSPFLNLTHQRWLGYKFAWCWNFLTTAHSYKKRPVSLLDDIRHTDKKGSQRSLFCNNKIIFVFCLFRLEFLVKITSDSGNTHENHFSSKRFQVTRFPSTPSKNGGYNLQERDNGPWSLLKEVELENEDLKGKPWTLYQFWHNASIFLHRIRKINAQGIL